jgi:DNA polymerase III subunit epsilon
MNRQHDRQVASKWASGLLAKGNFCILDTETTGLGSDDEICQIGVLDCTGEPLIDRLVWPMVPIAEAASAIHGITAETVYGSDLFDAVFLDTWKAVGKRDVVIYNAEFDLRLIRQSLQAYQIEIAFPTSDRRGCRLFPNGGSIHCAMLMYSQWVGDWNSYHGNYKWQPLPGGDHSALGDCRATLAILRQMANLEP